MYYNKVLHGLGSRRSVIRELFEFGKQKAAQEGEDKVYDFSIGNPSVPAPECLNLSLKEILDTTDSKTVHGYTSAQGDAWVRSVIAESIRTRFGKEVGAGNIYMTCGASAALCIAISALNADNDEFVLFAPYFPEYDVFVKAAGGKCVVVEPDRPDFQLDFVEFEKALNPGTKAVIINSPNNPSGVIYSEDTISRLSGILERKSKEYGHPIFIIADEPYRELVYDDITVPYVMNYYANTIVCYSFSKALSIPGERIGYVAVNPDAEDSAGLYAAVCGAGRAWGYVCAPSLMQRVVAKCIDARPDIASYKRNRDLLYGSLTEIGYECVHPDGAFYLFVKALEPDSIAFSERAKQLGLLLVPGNDFGVPDYVRVAYCVSYDTIERSLPAFKALFDSYR